MADNKKTAPANGNPTDDDFYDDVPETFPSLEDLAPKANSANPNTVGRLVAIWAVKNGVGQSENGPYPYTESITLVLDDGPEGDQFTDLIGPAPVELQLRYHAKGIQYRLAPRVEGMSPPARDEQGNIIRPPVPLKFRPILGRINTQASAKYRKGSPAVSLSIATPEEKEWVRKNHRAMIVAINKRLEAKANEVEDAEAFA